MFHKFIALLQKDFRNHNQDLRESIAFVENLNAEQFVELCDALVKNVGKTRAHPLIDSIFALLSENVQKKIVTDAFKAVADSGCGSLVYDDEGNIKAIEVNSEQAERAKMVHKVLNNKEYEVYHD